MKRLLLRKTHGRFQVGRMKILITMHLVFLQEIWVTEHKTNLTANLTLVTSCLYATSTIVNLPII